MEPEDRMRYLETNRRTWDGWARHHVGSPFYDVAGFRTGRCTLDALELEGVGEVRGRTLLHLQCHFGLSTLSWARRGAKVTGVDFSDEAIRTARELAAEAGLEASFVRSDLYDLPSVLQGSFDIVFASHGVLPWLPDLEAWARVVHHFLKPGGLFFLTEAHPFAATIDDRPEAEELRIFYPYFQKAEPLRFQQKGSYAVRDGDFDSVTYEWFHSLSAILGALLRAGLRITAYEEHPFAAYQIFPLLEEGEDRFWRLPPGKAELPLYFSLRATRD
jgi:2-polyprenyl-3-methyl-5-hydroxy-6-metoxy-1,4-benzoquinol methylase